MTDYNIRLIREMTETIETLVQRYVANEGTKDEFVTCITPSGVPWYWVRAEQAVKKGRKVLDKFSEE